MTCTICRLPERMRDEIELMLAQGWPYRRVASAFGVTRSTTQCPPLPAFLARV